MCKGRHELQCEWVDEHPLLLLNNPQTGEELLQNTQMGMEGRKGGADAID